MAFEDKLWKKLEKIEKCQHFNTGRDTRGVDSYYQSGDYEDHSPIVYPASNAHSNRRFELRPQLISILPNYRGMATEEPYEHITEFNEICTTNQVNGFIDEEVRLHLFPYSLRDKAKHWFLSLPARSITTWAVMKKIFLKEFYPISKTLDMRMQIKSFRKLPGELFHEAYESASGGVFMTRSSEDEWEFFEKLSKDSKTQASVELKTHNSSQVNHMSNSGGSTRNLEKELDEIKLLLPMFNNPNQGGSFNSVQVQEVCSLCGDASHYANGCKQWNPPMMEEQVNESNQIGQVAEEKATRESDTILSYTLLNPNHESQGRGHEVNMVDNLRNGKAYDNKVNFGVGLNVEKPVFEKFEETDMENNTIPFPKALESPNQFPYGKKGPKTQMIYLCVQKTKFNASLPKKVKLTEKVSDVISGSLPPKFKNPGTPLIFVTIGNVNIKKALLDLGASINILPSSLVERYELRTLKYTDILIQLADRSIRTPRGMLENVIVKVEDFHYPVDFIVMDIETNFRETKPVIILGRPFLTTIDALINCRIGVMDIPVGNKRSRLNIFNSLHTPDVQDWFLFDTNHEQVQKYAPDVKEKEEVRKSGEEGMTSEFMESQIRTNAEILMSQQESIQNLERELKKSE
ncbi:uncharacterized protein [Rutidosis leptorrhynchoides]|uniref:uncharacterized protein n=1 Tax=Rutidosis leptorrhynchoides TaxID=125765 RepID=UPI003A99A0FA